MGWHDCPVHAVCVTEYDDDTLPPTRLRSGRRSALDSHNVRRAFRKIVDAAELSWAEWTPREPRHSFVPLLSDGGISIEEIADLCGHSGAAVTETVYRHQLRPVLMNGAIAMDRIFEADSA